MLRDGLGGRGMGAGGNMGEVAAAIAKGQGEGLGGRAGEAIWPLNGDNTWFGFPRIPVSLHLQLHHLLRIEPVEVHVVEGSSALKVLVNQGKGGASLPSPSLFYK
jgi:hypothetical protein